jgi:hypothetical protein
VFVGASSIKDEAGNAVPFYNLPPVQTDENVLTMLPRQPLKAKTTYRVHVTGSIAGAAFVKDWSFTTEN